MGDDLGERLVRVGLLTRSALSEALAAAPPHGAAMVRELVVSGLAEDAVAGFFVAEGFGPLLEARDLAVADQAVSGRISTGMAWEFLVLPVRDTTAGTVVAMATPSDRHILEETRRALGREVVPTIARASDIERAIRAQRPDAADLAASAPAPRAERHDSEPPVLELTRRRAPGATPGYQSRAKGSDEAPAAKLGPRVSVAPGGDEPEAEAPLLLVRHKPVPRGATPSLGVPPPPGLGARTEGGSSPAIGIPARTFGRPRTNDGERSTTGEYASGKAESSAVVSVPPTPPASAEAPTRGARDSIHDALRSLTPSKPITRPPASALDAAAPAGTATAEAEARAGGPSASQSRMPRAGTSTSPGIARPGSLGITPKVPSLAPAGGGARAPAAGAPGSGGADAAKWARGGARPRTSTAPVEPASPAAASTSPSSAALLSSTTASPPASPVRDPADLQATLPPPAMASEDRWDLPARAAGEPTEHDNKVSRTSSLGSKAAAGDVGPVLASIRAARDRDTVVRLACDGAITVSRAAVFLALKKGVLKGWDGAGSGISRDSVRNLWIPAGSASMFKRVLDEGVAYVGPYGAGIADGLFKAAVGSRGGDVMVQPVLLEQKVVGLLCVDDVRPGPLARGRVESLANAVGEAFRRVISAGKTD